MKVRIDATTVKGMRTSDLIGLLTDSDHIANTMFSKDEIAGMSWAQFDGAIRRALAHVAEELDLRLPARAGTTDWPGR